MSHVYVLVDYVGGPGSGSAAEPVALSPVTAELITAARPLGVVSAVVVGAPGTADALVGPLGELGAVQVIDASAEDYAQRLITPEVAALQALGAANPAPIVITATPTGNEIAGRLGARLGSGVLANVVGIDADRSARHQIFGGGYSVTAVAGGPCPIYTVRPGAVAAENAAQPGEAQLAPMPLPAEGPGGVEVRSFTPKAPADRPELTQAKIVVAGGRGVGSAEGFREHVEGLADELGAAVGSTRDIVYDGWADPETQVGQTGATVSPDLYIALGISGAIQHTSGMRTSGTIVAVNQDGDEPIFDIADIAAVGDVEEIVPALIEQLRNR